MSYKWFVPIPQLSLWQQLGCGSFDLEIHWRFS